MSIDPMQATLAAKRRPRCTVGLDFRHRSRVGAVAVDRKGRLRAWATIQGDEGRLALAKAALDALSVTPTALRVLVGSELAQVGVFDGLTEPDASQICETLAGEGYGRILVPAVSAANAEADNWLVAGCDEGQVLSLVAELSELQALEPTITVDQLLLLQQLPAGSVAMESLEDGLLVVARLRQGAPLARSLPSLLDDGQQAREEALRTLQAIGATSHVWTLGSRGADLAPAFDQIGIDPARESMPACGEHVLPRDLELTWRLATVDQPAALGSPRLEERRSSMRWARRVATLGIVLGTLSVVLVAYALTEMMQVRARQQAEAANLAAIQIEIRQLEETAKTAKNMLDLQTELNPWSLPWPQLAPAIAELARNMPPAVGWDRLETIDGELDLEVSAAGAVPLADLMRVRRLLERNKGISNVSWDEARPSQAGAGLRQVFRAKLLASQDAAREMQ